MKFSNGAWLPAKGVNPGFVRRVTQYEIQGDTLLVWGVSKYGNQGADRFDGMVLGLEISSPMPDVIRVRSTHHQPEEKGVRGFDLDYRLKAKGVKIEDTADELIFTSGKATLRLKKLPWDISFEAEGEVVTRGGGDGPIYMRVSEGENAGAYMAQRLSLKVGECIYGMGERFGPLVKNGQSVSIWNLDGGTMSEQAYKNIPFYLSNKGYGVLVNSPAKVEFEVASERVSQIQFSVPGETLDYYYFYGPTPKEVLEKYTRLSGRPSLPPSWSYGLWLSTSFTTLYDEKTVTEFVDGMFERGIPLSVFHFDCFWMRERHWSNFEWDTQAFPDPKGMLKRLKAKGLKICVWINSYISNMSEMFAEGRAKGYFLKRANGDVYQVDDWQPGMAFVDFSNPAAVKWYQGKLRKLLEMGVDCFKTDFGERIPDDAVYFDGSDPKLMHNYYTYLYNKAVFDLLEEFHGKEKAMVFARSATAGGQKFAVHWGGDCFATFESMAEDLRGGLSFCTSGAAFWSHDIGGFEGKANPTLYKRWVAFGLLSTHSRLHGSGTYRVPWLFDEESVDVMRHFVKLKNSLFPYLYAASRDAANFGWPVMRAMPVEFCEDPACAYLDRQYMLGSSLLVAPVFRQDNVAEYYLPRGKWTNLLTDEVVDGGIWRSELQDFFHVPLFVRENTLLPVSDDNTKGEWNANEALTLHVFQIADGAEVSADAASGDGKVIKFTCQRDGQKLTISSSSAKTGKVRVVVHGVEVAKVSNGSTGEGSAIAWKSLAKSLVIELA